jgi:hypothetical protein
MRASLFAVVLMLLAGTVSAQVPPIRRYNSIAETTFLLHQCNALTPERRDWLKHLLDHSLRQLGWPADQLAAHDAALTKDLTERYPTVDKARCEVLARNIDQERKTTIVVP